MSSGCGNPAGRPGEVPARWRWVRRYHAAARPHRGAAPPRPWGHSGRRCRRRR